MNRLLYLISASVVLLTAITLNHPAPAETRTMAEKPRLLVLTDISSLTAGVREPDDGQSLIRLLLYSNEIEIEGLIASSNLGHGQVVRPELIREAVDAYAQVRTNLLLHSDSYPTAETLRDRIKGGQPVAGEETPVMDSIGEGKDTPGSEWIINRVDRRDVRPLWVAIWGGAADLGQALWKVRRTRTPEQLGRFVAKLRVHSIGDQDTVGPWIRAEFPDLFYIKRVRAYRGMYRGGDEALVGREWVETNVRRGHGALGALYPNYNGGDIFSARLGPVRGIKEGDTPSYLSLIGNGLGDPAEPLWGGWGGRLTLTDNNPKRLTDATDAQPNNSKDPDPRMSTVYRWRPAFQADFQARLDWCVQPYADANHPPVVRVAGDLRRTVRAGERVVLDARGSIDPDKDTLTYEWSVYPEAGTYQGVVTINDATTPVAAFTAPKVDVPCLVHVILMVQDDGEPRLTAYRRVVIRLEP